MVVCYNKYRLLWKVGKYCCHRIRVWRCEVSVNNDKLGQSHHQRRHWPFHHYHHDELSTRPSYIYYSMYTRYTGTVYQSRGKFQSTRRSWCSDVWGWIQHSIQSANSRFCCAIFLRVPTLSEVWPLCVSWSCSSDLYWKHSIGMACFASHRAGCISRLAHIEIPTPNYQ